MVAGGEEVGDSAALIYKTFKRDILVTILVLPSPLAEHSLVESYNYLAHYVFDYLARPCCGIVTQIPPFRFNLDEMKVN